jgi:hypothetical protein
MILHRFDVDKVADVIVEHEHEHDHDHDHEHERVGCWAPVTGS